jgi:hypothetical protein
MTVLGRGDLAPPRRARRRRSPYAAVLVVLALLAAGGWLAWQAWHGSGSSTLKPTVVCVTPTPSASPGKVKTIKISVFNGTTTVGLAHTVAGQLTRRGFAVVRVGTGHAMTGPSRITYSPGEVDRALALQEQVPGATLYELSTQRPGEVRLDIGTGFHRLATPAQVSAARARDLAAAAPSPAVCTTPRG